MAGRQVEEWMARQAGRQACRVPKAVRPAGRASNHGMADIQTGREKIGGWARVARQRSSEGRWTGQCKLAGMPGKGGWH